MKAQQDLFDTVEALPPAARRRRTSVEAAAAAQPRQRSRRARVLECIQAGPKTDQEIAESLGLSENSVRPRRVELERKGLIRDSGKTRPTAAGRRAMVWEAVPGPSSAAAGARE